MCLTRGRGLHCAGVFHTRHEDGQSGRVWEGIIKYHIGATLDQPDVSPDRRLSVSHHTSETKGTPHPSLLVCVVFQYIVQFQAEAPLVIFDGLDCRKVDMIPDKQTATGNVKTFFCIQRGEVRVTTG